MDKWLRVLAIGGNGLLLLAAVYRLVGVYRLGDVFFLGFLLLLAVLDLWILGSGPDREERRLQRDVAKAELRQRLRVAEQGLNTHAERK